MAERKAKCVTQKDGLEKKHEHPSACIEGKHTYIVTSWLIGGSKQKAIQMRCRHCLMPLDLQEIESGEWAKTEGI